MSPNFIRADELASAPGKPGRWPISKPTLWRWSKTGKLPKPVKLGPGVTAWPLDAIEKIEAEWAVQASAQEDSARAESPRRPV